MKDTMTNPLLTLQRMITGYWPVQCLHTVAVLGIADELADGAKTVEDTAANIGCNASYLYRVMRALAGIGVFEEVGNRAFRNTELSECLRSDVPHSLREFAIMHGDSAQWNAWGGLLEAVKHGETAFGMTHQSSFFEYMVNNPEAGNRFNEVMTTFSQQDAAAILDNYDFGQAQRVVDIGAGQGQLLVNILSRYPSMEAVYFDQPHVVHSSQERLAEWIDQGALVTRGGSFFDSVPEGGDLYLLKYILHDWEDSDARAILQTIRRAMSSDSKLLIIEQLIPEGNAPSFAKWLDVQMLVMLGGSERTEAEYRDLLESSGFRISCLKSTSSRMCLIEATPF